MIGQHENDLHVAIISRAVGQELHSFDIANENLVIIPPSKNKPTAFPIYADGGHGEVGKIYSGRDKDQRNEGGDHQQAALCEGGQIESGVAQNAKKQKNSRKAIVSYGRFEVGLAVFIKA